MPWWHTYFQNSEEETRSLPRLAKSKFGLKLISSLTFVWNFSTVNSTTWESRPLVLHVRRIFMLSCQSILHVPSTWHLFLHEFEQSPTAKRLSIKFTSNLWQDDKISLIFDQRTQTGDRFVNFLWFTFEWSLQISLWNFFDKLLCIHRVLFLLAILSLLDSTFVRENHFRMAFRRPHESCDRLLS